MQNPPPVDPSALPELEIAHVLFMDLVGYSKLPMDRQTRVIQQLNEIVSGAAEYQRAQARDQLIRLPTGDGMALVFFRDPEAPVQCALEIARALGSIPDVKLRMGVHAGPVYRVADINANKNVAGGGVNLAQRVMDCGDAGHILVSDKVADVLGQLSKWANCLHDLGEQKVKHGVRVHLFNLYTPEAGNPHRPKKLSRKTTVAIPALVLAAVLLAAGTFRFLLKPPPQQRGLEQTLTYSVTVEKLRDGKPFQFQLPGEVIFEKGNKIRLNLSSPQTGYLYILNEGPEPQNGMPSYNMLFPSPTSNRGSPFLAANQPAQIPAENWFVFDQEAGTEKLWLVWSSRSVAEMEAVKGWANPSDRGAISDPGQIKAVHEFLAKHADPGHEVAKDYEKRQTNVRGRGDVLVHFIRLEHQ